MVTRTRLEVRFSTQQSRLSRRLKASSAFTGTRIDSLSRSSKNATRATRPPPCPTAFTHLCTRNHRVACRRYLQLAAAVSSHSTSFMACNCGMYTSLLTCSDPLQLCLLSQSTQTLDILHLIAIHASRRNSYALFLGSKLDNGHSMK